MRKIMAAVLVAAAAGVVSAADAYLPASGTQIIDSGYYPNVRTRVEVDYQFTAKPAGGDQVRLFGQNNQDMGNDNFLQFYSSSSQFGLGYGNSWNGSYYVTADLNRHTVIYDSPEGKAWFVTGATTNATVELSASHDKTATGSMAIFGRHFWSDHTRYGNGAGIAHRFDQGASAKIYSVKIYEKSDDTYSLIHHFYPVIDADGKAKLKDAVSGRVCGNVCTATPDALFNYGGDIEDLRADAYVESSNTADVYKTAVMDSGYYVNANSRIEVDFRLTAIAADRRIIGQNNEGAANKDNFLQFFVDGGSAFALGYGNSYTKCQMPAADLNRHTVIYDAAAAKAYFVTGLTTNQYTLTTARDITATKTMAIFGRHFWSDSLGIAARYDAGAAVRIYSVKIYEKVDDACQLVRDYQPVLDSDGRAKLIDRWNNLNRCLDNANSSATGTFTCGGDILRHCAEAYLESDGTQAIDTGYYVNGRTRIEADFALTATDAALVAQTRLFGADGIDNGNYLTLYINNAPGLTLGYGNTWHGNNGLGVNGLDLNRHTFVYDAGAKAAWCTRAAGLATGIGLTEALDGTSVRPLAIFARYNGYSSTADTFDSNARMRLYAMRIYEDGVMLHQYFPYKNGDVVGLYDTVTGDVKLNADLGANAFVYGEGRCNNYEGTVPGTLAVAPKAKYGVTEQKPAVISVLAPGAYRYVWKKNGEMVAGADAATLEVTADEVRGNTAYSVQAVYLVDGVEVPGPMAETSVSQTGMVIIVR